MEFPFPVTKLFQQKITKVQSSLVPEGVAEEASPLGRQCAQRVSQVVDALGRASAAAQRLPRAVTSADRLRSSDHTLYVLKDPDDASGNGRLAGFLKTGYKNLYLFDKNGNSHETRPLCVLDFFIHEDLQRRGLGKELFDHMLSDCDVAPKHLALDSPSDSFMAFVRKNYGLFRTIPQVNHYYIYDDFFSKRPDGRAQYPMRAHGRVALKGRRAAVAASGGEPSNESTPHLDRQQALVQQQMQGQQQQMQAQQYEVVDTRQPAGQISQVMQNAQEATAQIPKQHQYLHRAGHRIPAQQHTSLPGRNWSDPRCSSVGDCLSYPLYGSPWSDRAAASPAPTAHVPAAGYVVPRSARGLFSGSPGVRPATSAVCTHSAIFGTEQARGDAPVEPPVPDPLVSGGGAIDATPMPTTPCASPPPGVLTTDIPEAQATTHSQQPNTMPAGEQTISQDQCTVPNPQHTVPQSEILISPEQPLVAHDPSSMSPGLSTAEPSQHPTVHDQPTMLTDQTMMTPGEHAISNDQSMISSSEPMKSSGQPMMLPGQPMMSPGQPMMSPGQPMMSPGQLMMPPGQPMMSPGQPMMSPGQLMMSPGHHPMPPGQPAVPYGPPSTGPAVNTASKTYQVMRKAKYNHTPLW